MKSKTQKQWERLGANDPYWAVLSNPEKRGKNWDKDEFFSSGRTEIENVFRRISDSGISLKKTTALDFGCGVGRISRAMSFYFDKVKAVDISGPMLEEARSQNSHLDNIDFVHNTRSDLAVFPENSVDFLYSNIVLQHIPRKKQEKYIKEFCRILAVGGVLVFQTPSKPKANSLKGFVYLTSGNHLLNIARRIKYGRNSVMEMHCLPRRIALRMIRDEGLKVIGYSENGSSGASFKSYTYFAQKSIDGWNF